MLAKVKGFDVLCPTQHAETPLKKDTASSMVSRFPRGQHSEEKIPTANPVIKSPGIPDKADIVKEDQVKEDSDR